MAEIAGVAFAALVLWWVVGPLVRMAEPAEAVMAHRYRSVRLAMIVGMLLMGGWVLWHLYVNAIIRWDLLLTLAAMTATKLTAMVYLRFADERESAPAGR
jgi:hypothetical protein